MRKHSIGWCDNSLPLWAVEDSTIPSSSNHSLSLDSDQNHKISSIIINDIKMMSDEVSALLTELDEQIAQQRLRRFNRLKAPPLWRRNWYMVALGVPFGFYISYKLFKDRFGISLLKQIFSKLTSFYAEHVSEPITDM